VLQLTKEKYIKWKALLIKYVHLNNAFATQEVLEMSTCRKSTTCLKFIIPNILLLTVVNCRPHFIWSYSYRQVQCMGPLYEDVCSNVLLSPDTQVV